MLLYCFCVSFIVIRVFWIDIDLAETYTYKGGGLGGFGTASFGKFYLYFMIVFPNSIIYEFHHPSYVMIWILKMIALSFILFLILVYRMT